MVKYKVAAIFNYTDLLNTYSIIIMILLALMLFSTEAMRM